MVASLDVDPDDLRAQAARIESIRAAVHPGSLPVGFSPAGSDPASVLAANSISVQAAQTVNGLWSVWRQLGEIVDKLRPTADGYQSQDGVSQTNLSSVDGTWSPGTARPQVPTPEVAPVAVPQVHTASPAASPEQLSTAIHSGPGASSPETFATAWSSHAGTVESAAADLQNIKGSLGSNWSGITHDGAQRTVGGVHRDLVVQSGSLTKVSGWASTHAADFRTAVDPAGGIPHPNQFAVWNQNLNNAVAANNQYPGVYNAAVLQAQNDLNQGYTQTGTAYGQYAIDPVTGQAVDPATGEPIDPATGEPLGDDVADAATDESASDPEQMLSMGAQLLTGLVGGALGAVGAGVGAIAQAGQQGAQMATSSLGQIAKSAASASEPDLGDTGLPDAFGGGAGDFGGGGGGGGGPTEPAAVLGPSVGTASAPPSVTPQTPAGPGVPSAGRPGMGPMGGMGAPFMPMGGGMGAGARPGDAKAEASPNGKKMVAPVRPNTERVIGEIESGRMDAKSESRKQKREEAKRALLAETNAKTE